ncbi:putative C6 transcription factor [Aspergillus carlsbadensis]|nr:putative C6 transcription factor [Aspergillus carlsbadensis]
MARPRKRLTLACDTCRSRRVKCDGQRPYCAPCRIRGLDCFYQQLPESPATKVETELANVNLRLDYLTMLLSKQQSSPLVQQSPHTSTSRTVLGSHEDSPFCLLASDSIMRVLGLDEGFAHAFGRLERANLLLGATTPPGMFFFSQQQVTDALATFSDRIHGYYPILPLGFSETYFATLAAPLAPSARTCLVLLVAAIGCVARDPAATTGGSSYFDAALQSLPVVLAECTLTSIQCLIFLSIYYCCLLKPCQAHDYCLIASFKIQNLFKSGLQGAESDSLELTHRAYWAILLLERQSNSELSVQLDVAKSNIWSLDEYTPLPNCRRTWHFPPLQSTVAASAHSPDSISTSTSTSTTVDQAQSFFLAEIAMRRMLHRCNWAVTQSPEDGAHRYAPGIALELERQLDEWYGYLPPNIQFIRETQHQRQQQEQASVVLGSLSNFLNVQYYCCKLSIYWPAVFQAMQDASAPSAQLLDHCQRFIDSYVQLLQRITFAMDDCLVYKWTLSVSFFTTTLAALKVSETPCLGSANRDALRRCLASAADVDCWRGTEGSPSLGVLQRTLRERLHEAGLG